MASRNDSNETSKLVRTSILIPEDIDRALRDFADAGKRPLSWEIRAALEAYVEERRELEAA